MQKPSETNIDGMRSWIWRKIDITLPDTWEMLRFAADEDEGSCGFADETGFRFFLYWQRRKKQPDFDRDARRFLKRHLPGGQVIEAPVNGWFGWEEKDETRTIRQFAKHFPTEGLVLTAVFRTPPRKPLPEQSILASIAPREPAADNQIPWKIRDFTCLVPADQPLHEGTFETGKTKLVFRANPKKEPVYTFQKWALVNEWMPARDLERWIKRQIPAAYKLTAIKRAEWQDHTYISLTASARHRWFPFRHHPKRYFEMVAWICPEDDCLYAASQQVFSPQGNWSQPMELPLQCCSRGPQISL
ncbi:MAG: hypothetical protein JJT75_11350 [Opitutales bacterium]|nr:hypothetical protein [Opitutales bacterium]MCH8540370.1 hypothetical protein [Opitutales bacterium]